MKWHKFPAEKPQEGKICLITFVYEASRAKVKTVEDVLSVGSNLITDLGFYSNKKWYLMHSRTKFDDFVNDQDPHILFCELPQIIGSDKSWVLGREEEERCRVKWHKFPDERPPLEDT